VEAGETVTCTFNNSFAGTADSFIVVRKETNPADDPQVFNFSGDVAGDIADNGSIAVKVSPGQYTSTETATADWQLDVISCDDSNSSGSGSTATFNVEAGETVTCTFNNSFAGTADSFIVVRKETNPADDPQVFNFTGDVAGDIADNGSIAVKVTPGQYTSTETEFDGWTLESISCDDNNSSGSGSTATFNVEAGESVTCTFVNQRGYPAIEVNAYWALLLLILTVLVSGWYFRPTQFGRR
jgi:hypothetical protein